MLLGRDYLNKMLDDMSPLLVQAKVSIKSVDRLRDDCTEEMLECRVAFLKSLHEGIWKEAKKTWNLLPEVVWERYTLFGISGLAEQVKLATQLRFLRESFHAGFQVYSAKRMKPVRRHQPTAERGTPEDRAKLKEQGKLATDKLPGLPEGPSGFPEHTPPDNMKKDEEDHGNLPPQQVEDSRVPGNSDAASEK